MTLQQTPPDDLRKIGLNIIPCYPRSKKPSIDWKPFQEEKYTESIPKNYNSSVICGKTSNNLVVIDIDSPELFDKIFEDVPKLLETTLTVKTGSGGYHVYCRCEDLPSTMRFTNSDKQHVDIQSQGAYVISPGSIHPNGQMYEKISKTDEIKTVEIKDILKQLVKLGFDTEHHHLPIDQIMNGVGEGSRNDSAFKYSMFLLDTKKLDKETVWFELQEWNKKTVTPPMDERELRLVFESASKRFSWKKKNGDSFVIHEDKDKTTEIEILDHEIKELHAQALIDDIAYICVYFPTRRKEIKKDKTEYFYENAGFIISADGKRKQVFRVNDEWVKANFKVSVLSTWNCRWFYNDFQAWKTEAESTHPLRIFNKLKSIVKNYIDFPDEATYNVLVLWIIGTYFYRLFKAYPYLEFTGTKRAGKTKTLDIIKHASFNSIMSPDFTGSTIFRLVEGTGATLCLDEAENFKNLKSENAQHVRTLLIQGFLKDQFAYRTDKDNFEVKPYDLYSPKALAHIHAFDDVLEDRCIQIVMNRSTNKQLQNAHPNDYEFIEIRNMCYRLFLDYAVTINNTQKLAEKKMTVFGRELSLWLPIATLAFFFDAHGASGLTESIVAYSKTDHHSRQARDEEENQDYRIARFLNTQKTDDGSWLKTGDIFSNLMQIDDKGNGPKKDFDIPDNYTKIKLGHCLKRLGLPKQHNSGGSFWEINDKTITEVYERFGIEAESGKNLSNLSNLSQQEQKIHSYADRSDNSDRKNEKTPLDSDTMGGTGVIDE